jgi:3-oxoadipate enol-lactonase
MTLPATLTQGAGDTALFLLHGIGGGKEAWASNLPAFAQAGYRVLAWDMPGYGASSTIEPYTIDLLARSLVRLIDHVGARRNLVLGHSMGGMVAQEAVALFPNKIQGLLLSGTSPSFGRQGGAWQQQFLSSRFAPLDTGLGMAGLANNLVPGMMAGNASDEARAAAIAVMARVPEASYRAALGAIVSFNRLDNLPRIDLPVLCLAGEHDSNATPLTMQKMAQRIAGASYLCLPGVGHIANVEQPLAFNDAVLGFLRQHFPV